MANLIQAAVTSLGDYLEDEHGSFDRVPVAAQCRRDRRAEIARNPSGTGR
jgi:hypothetical protein